MTSTLEERKKKLAERLRARGLHDLADGVATAPEPKRDFDEASRLPPRAPLSRERIDARNAAIKAAKALKTPPAPRRLTNCPTCTDGHVVPFDGDGDGNVTVWRCLTCKTNFKNQHPSFGQQGLTE